MAVITSYATLQTAIADYLARDDLTTYIPNFIQNCENKLRRTLNLRNEESLFAENVSSGKVTVPGTFKAMKFCYYDSGSSNAIKLLQFVPVDELYRDYPNRSQTSTSPKVVAREGSFFVFGPVAADGTGVFKGIYYSRQDPLRTTDPSWYVSNAPEVLLYGSLLEAKPFIMDDARIPVWAQFFQEAVETLKQENDNAETSLGSIVQRGGVMP